MKLTKGFVTDIHSYKHNEIIHRVWRNTKIVDASDDLLITAHKKTRVFEQSGRSWLTKEPAICYFYKDLWFNVIVMFKRTGIVYYCNLSSPYIYDGEAIKYIDYDLDVKVFPNGEYIILDKNEYRYHARIMDYPNNIKKVVEDELKKLVKLIENKEPPFDKAYVLKHYKEAFEREYHKK